MNSTREDIARFVGGELSFRWPTNVGDDSLYVGKIRTITDVEGTPGKVEIVFDALARQIISPYAGGETKYEACDHVNAKLVLDLGSADAEHMTGGGIFLGRATPPSASSHRPCWFRG